MNQLNYIPSYILPENNEELNINNIINKELYNKISSFKYKFPKNKHLELFLNTNNINTYLEHSYPIITNTGLNIINTFIDLIKDSKNQKEKRTTSTKKQLIRLINNKPVMFSIKLNKWILKNDFNVIMSMNQWEPENKSSDININEYMTLFEMELSSLIVYSICTPLLNRGSKKDPFNIDNYHQKEGIIICLPRFICDKPTFFDWKYLLIDPNFNLENNGYGNKNNKYLNLWSVIYNMDIFPRYSDVIPDPIDPTLSTNVITNFAIDYNFPKYIKLDSHREIFFNLHAYISKIKFFAKIFLLEANYRAFFYKKNVFCHITIPYFNILNDILQWNIYVETWKQIFIQGNYKYIDKLYFSTDLVQKDIRDNNFIFSSDRISCGNRLPYEILDDRLLLIKCVEYDPCSYIGNEFYEGTYDNDNSLSAFNTFISYLGNPDINNFKFIKKYNI